MLIRLAEEFETPVHIVHLASAQALPMLAEARGRGVPVTVETCTHYLWFAAEEIPDGATEYKCAPPIRSAENREALWKALEDGLIDMVTTDHSPCPPEMKRRERRPLGPGLGRYCQPGPGAAGAVDGDAPARIGHWSGSANGWPRRRRGWRDWPDRKGALAAGRRRGLCGLRSGCGLDRRAGASAFSAQAFALPGRGVARAGAGDLAARRAGLRRGWIHGRARAAESWCADERARSPRHCGMPAHCRHERGAGAHYAPVSHAAGARCSCASCAAAWKRWA